MLERIYKAQTTMSQAYKTLGKKINIMEVCGTHTVSIFRSGIRATLPEGINLLTGPGCPVCVTDQSYIDATLKVADKEDCIIATYGDMIRVPGHGGSLETRQSNKNIKIVLSSEDALDLARNNPKKTVVFAAVGFETTAPATAVIIDEAIKENIENFTILSGHKLVIPAMRALLSDPKNNIDAFLCPGHVSAVTGYGIFKEIADDFHRPCVVAGFEPMQIIEGLAEIASQMGEGKAYVKSIYDAVVTEQGNPKAKEMISKYFDAADGYWRGLGLIEKSTLKLKKQYSRFDAFEKFGLEETQTEDLNGCRCGEVLCGQIKPTECELFGAACTPNEPVGPCIVSSEGACAAWYKYGR